MDSGKKEGEQREMNGFRVGLGDGKILDEDCVVSFGGLDVGCWILAGTGGMMRIAGVSGGSVLRIENRELGIGNGECTFCVCAVY